MTITSYVQMAVKFGTGVSFAYGSLEIVPTVSPWNHFNPRYYFRTVSWYLPFHDRMKIERWSK